MPVGILSRSPRFRPVLEEFEDRLVPASYLWMPFPGGNLNWNTPANWWEWSDAAGDYVPPDKTSQIIPGVAIMSLSTGRAQKVMATKTAS